MEPEALQKEISLLCDEAIQYVKGGGKITAGTLWSDTECAACLVGAAALNRGDTINHLSYLHREFASDAIIVINHHFHDLSDYSDGITFLFDTYLIEQVGEDNLPLEGDAAITAIEEVRDQIIQKILEGEEDE